GRPSVALLSGTTSEVLRLVRAQSLQRRDVGGRRGPPTHRSTPPTTPAPRRANSDVGEFGPARGTKSPTSALTRLGGARGRLSRAAEGPHARVAVSIGIDRAPSHPQPGAASISARVGIEVVAPWRVTAIDAATAARSSAAGMSAPSASVATRHPTKVSPAAVV